LPYGGERDKTGIGTYPLRGANKKNRVEKFSSRSKSMSSAPDNSKSARGNEEEEPKPRARKKKVDVSQLKKTLSVSSTFKHIPRQ